MYTTCEAGKRRMVNHTRARARSPRRAGPGRAGPGRAVAVAVAEAEAEARRGAAGRPDGRCACACACACAAERDVQVRCGAVRRGAVRCDVMAILPLTAINRAIKRAIKSVINGHNRIT